MSNIKLPRSFFERPTLAVARDLIGKRLIYQNFSGLITETEAYIGKDDTACHAAKGRTKRTEVMFGSAGHAYVYFIYGMYYCMNIVTEEEDFPAAVLIRGLVLDQPYEKNLDGPGKLCRELGLNKDQHNGLDMISSQEFYVEETHQQMKFIQTPRIGIKVGTDKLWRFLAKS